MKSLAGVDFKLENYNLTISGNLIFYSREFESNHGSQEIR